MSTDPRSTVDGRSVGELLLDADLHARSALWDPDPDKATARVRTWGEVVEAAAALWATIPGRDHGPTMAQIQARALRPNSRWPRGGEGDFLLETTAASLNRAADLVGARRHPSAPLSEAGQMDAEAARTRVMHTVYVASHAVALSLDHHVRDLRRQREAGRAVRPGDSITHARATRDRATAVERLAGLYLEARWPTALAGQRQDHADATRLEEAVARWDIAAHRALTRTPTFPNLATVSRVQAELAISTSVVAAAAAHAGLLDAVSHTQRIAPALDDAERAWAHLGADLWRLGERDRQLDPELLLAANELKASLREYTHDQAGLAQPSTIAGRTDLEDITRTLHRAVAASPDIAQTLQQVLQDVELTASARSTHALATARLGPDGHEAWVGPAGMAQNRQMPLPESVRSVLVKDAERAVRAAGVADSVAGALSPGGRASVRPHSSAPVADARRLQERHIPQRDPAGPRLGCERG